MFVLLGAVFSLGEAFNRIREATFGTLRWCRIDQVAPVLYSLFAAEAAQPINHSNRESSTYSDGIGDWTARPFRGAFAAAAGILMNTRDSARNRLALNRRNVSTKKN